MSTDNNNNEIESIIVEKPKAVLKSYSALTLLANILISISTVGFTAVGALTKLNVMYLVGTMSVMSIIGFAGRFIKQDLSDTETDGPMGFRGVSIRFVWFLENLFKTKFSEYKTKIKSWFQ